MVDFRTERSLGARIQAARKMRGMRSTKDLADAIKGGNLTESILENIESGRKASLDISQLLNIALALRMPLSYLLAPLGTPNAPLDLPNLSDGFKAMTALEFDSWLTTATDGAYFPATLEERNAIAELQALRAWSAQNAEVRRLEIALELEMESTVDADSGIDYARSTKDRLDDARNAAEKLSKFLHSAGWALD
jgi:transcriptional regulator with XRE-family HTH domain